MLAVFEVQCSAHATLMILVEVKPATPFVAELAA